MIPPIQLTALSRTVVTRNYALITGDGFVNSVVPGWSGCTVNTVISGAMGAQLTQLIASFAADAKPSPSAAYLSGTTQETQIFFYVLEGGAQISVGGAKPAPFAKGGFAYIPVGTTYRIDKVEKGSRFLSFHKRYEYLEDAKPPRPIIGTQSRVKKEIYANDPMLLMQYLLPAEQDIAFDMGINIFTYKPGAYLPFVETHIMEHGLMYLEGQGIYRLDDKWYPVRAGDCIWMAPYCPQWFGALGRENAVYIYYKNVNRHSIAP